MGFIPIFGILQFSEQNELHMCTAVNVLAEPVKKATAEKRGILGSFMDLCHHTTQCSHLGSQHPSCRRISEMDFRIPKAELGDRLPDHVPGLLLPMSTPTRWQPMETQDAPTSESE